jgi:SAM-dependent methyltransferase
MIQFDRGRMLDHVAKQDVGYAASDAFAIRNSTLVQHSRIHKELFLLSMVIEELLKMDAPKRLLEVGCGVGTMTGALRAISNEVVAFDISPAGVAATQNLYHGWPGIITTVADGTDPESNPKLATGNFDVILIREFHPFKRDFYDTPEEAARVHGETLGAYIRLLAPGGGIVICHAEDKAQSIRPENLSLPDDIAILVSRVDPRLVAAFLFLTRNNIGRAIRLARLFQPLAWKIASHNVLYVLKKGGKGSP